MKSFFVLTAALVLGLSVAATPASASVVYSYVTDASAYSGSAGGTVTVNVFLDETLSGSNKTSIINANNGLFGAGVGIQLSGTSTTGSIVSSVNPNTASAANGGFGATSIGAAYNMNVGGNGTNGALSEAVGVASGGGSNPGPLATQSSSTLFQVFLGSYTIALGETAGTDTWTVSSLFNSANTVLGGANGNTVTETGNFDLDKNHTGATAYTGANNTTNSFSVTVTQNTATPEPSSMALCGLAVGGLAFRAWRRRKGQIATELDATPEENPCA
jgi:hypothetical protein